MTQAADLFNAAASASRTLPDPFAEMRILAMSSLRGANYWSRKPVTRMDVTIGAYEDHSSADAPWLAEQLVSALPGLVEHRCSVGRRGGFVHRLKEGTYAAHIAEHVALELQSMMGHDTGFGRTRGTGELAEYTVVIEHRHEAVALRALALALETVQRAFAGTLESVAASVTELRALALTPDVPPIHNHVLCGITGGGSRAATRDALNALGVGNHDEAGLVIDVAPGYLLQAGLPYARSDIAIILDANLTDVPERFTDSERAARLVGILADAVPRGGVVVCPSNLGLVHDVIRDAGRVVRKFARTDDPAIAAERAATAASEALATTNGAR